MQVKEEKNFVEHSKKTKKKPADVEHFDLNDFYYFNSFTDRILNVC